MQVVLVGVGLPVAVDHQQVGAESLAQYLLGEDLVGPAEGHQVAVQAGGVVAGAGHAGQVVGAQHHRGPARLEVPDDVQHLVLGGGVQPR